MPFCFGLLLILIFFFIYYFIFFFILFILLFSSNPCRLFRWPRGGEINRPWLRQYIRNRGGSRRRGNNNNNEKTGRRRRRRRCVWIWLFIYFLFFVFHTRDVSVTADIVFSIRQTAPLRRGRAAGLGKFDDNTVYTVKHWRKGASVFRALKRTTSSSEPTALRVATLLVLLSTYTFGGLTTNKNK